MKFSIQWLIALGLTLLPLLLLMPLGLLWLWQHNSLLWLWLSGGLACTMGGWMWVQYLHQKQFISLIDETKTEPNKRWNDRGQGAWQRVKKIAESVNPDDFPLEHQEKWFNLGKTVLESVAQHYHPDSEHPIAEIPIPYVLKIIELVSEDLRINFVENVPGSHIITIHDIFRGQRFSTLAKKYYRLYRLLSMPLNPTSSLFREFQGMFTKTIVNAASENIKLWLLQMYIKKVGYYAVELYSGTMVLDEIAFAEYQPAKTQTEVQMDSPSREIPLRILVLGQVNSGKSSLINGLFGQLRIATDILPSTDHVKPYVLEKDGVQKAIVFDSAGYENQFEAKKSFARIESDILCSDLIVLVCSAVNGARQADKIVLNELTYLYKKQLYIPMPSVLVILTHIDQLRPLREWNPPYNIEKPDTQKSTAIRAAMEAVAEELKIDLARVIPACLKPDQLYNMQEGVIPAVLAHLESAKRTQYLRCIQEFRSEQDWLILWQQARKAGKILFNTSVDLASKFVELSEFRTRL